MKTRKEKVDAIIEILQESAPNYNGLKSEIVRLYKHMIKCIYQPKRHTDSWDKSIDDAYKNIKEFMNTTHYNKLCNDFDRLYSKALREANRETTKEGDASVDVVKCDNDSKDKVRDTYTLEKLHTSKR